MKELLKMLEIALEDYSALRPIDDNAESQRGRMALIDLIIENPTLKSLIMQGYSRHEGTDIKDELVRTKQRHHINIILMLNTVEDDLDTLLQTLKLILEGNGFIVKGFVNPYQALDYFIQSKHNCRLVTSAIERD